MQVINHHNHNNLIYTNHLRIYTEKSLQYKPNGSKTISFSSQTFAKIKKLNFFLL